MKKMTYIIIGGVVIIIVAFIFLSKKCVSTFDPTSKEAGGGCYYVWQRSWWGNYDEANVFKQSVGKEIIIEGKAMDAKAGAVLATYNGMVYIEGKDYWPENLINQNIAMKGRLAFKEYIPKYVTDKDGLSSQGINGGNQYVLEDANLIIIN